MSRKYIVILLTLLISILILTLLYETKIRAVSENIKTEQKVLYWYDPMVPAQRFDKPGKSPFMDMELVPKYAEEPSLIEAASEPVISIDSENIQKMGVRTEKVTKTPLSGGLRVTGTIMENERLRYDMFSQVEGRVEELNISAPFDQVKKGDLFYSLYSPELLALQYDYLAALQSGYKDLAASAAKRLTLLGVDKQVLTTLAKTRKVVERVPFYIPADGVLTRLEIRKGHYLMANAEIGHIQDYSTVWVEAALSEKDISQIMPGATARVMLAGTSTALSASVDYIYPDISSETRTARVRLVVENPEGLLKPGGYVTVRFHIAASERLTVPNAAILRSSEGEHVLIALGQGKFQARSVATGFVSEGRTEILSGLLEGEVVVTSSQFLIDSESNLQESLQPHSTGGDDAKQ